LNAIDENQGVAVQATPWGLWATVGFSLVITAAYVAIGVFTTLGMVAYNALVSPPYKVLANTDNLEANGLLLSLATVATFAICTGLILVFAGMRSRITIKDYLLLKHIPAASLFRWIAVALAFAFGWDAVNVLLGRPIVPEFMHQAYSTAGFTPLFWLALIIAAPVLEELFFRGFLFSGLQQSRLGMIGTIGVTAGIWAIIHVQYEIWDIFWICIMGVLLGIARVRTGSIYTPMVLHMLLNLIATIETAYFVAVHGSA
jgi:membrane protease YdiL (CAAX protease family)